MLLFDKYTRHDAPRWKAIYLTQEPVAGRRAVRYRVEPKQEAQNVFVDAISPEHARHFYEQEFHVEVIRMVEV